MASFTTVIIRLSLIHKVSSEIFVALNFVTSQKISKLTFTLEFHLIEFATILIVSIKHEIFEFDIFIKC